VLLYLEESGVLKQLSIGEGFITRSFVKRPPLNNGAFALLGVGIDFIADGRTFTLRSSIFYAQYHIFFGYKATAHDVAAHLVVQNISSLTGLLINYEFLVPIFRP
jgi:hypothetical protein